MCRDRGTIVVCAGSGVIGGWRCSRRSSHTISNCPDRCSGISTVMESSETTSTVNALGLIPLFSLECRVVLAEVLCSAVLCSAGVVGGGRD